MEIELEEETKRDEQQIPFYVTAIFIAVSGVGFLIFTVYYIAFLPVPTAMQPLRMRVLTTLQLEEALENNIDIVTVVADQKISVYAEPNSDSEIIAELAEAGFYQRIDEEDEWTKIESEEGAMTGWVESNHIEEVDEDN